MGITTYTVSSKRGDGVEVRREVHVNDEDVRSRDVVIRSAMRREPWYAGGDIRILESRRREEVSITRMTADMSQLHQSAYQAMSQSHSLLAQHAGQGCPSCAGFQPSVRTMRDTMSQSGYASQSPQAKPVMGGVQLHPALLPGEGKHPPIADRDPITGMGNGTGRATLAELSRLNCGDYLNMLVPVTSRRKRG